MSPKLDQARHRTLIWTSKPLGLRPVVTRDKATGLLEGSGQHTASNVMNLLLHDLARLHFLHGNTTSRVYRLDVTEKGKKLLRVSSNQATLKV